MSAFYSSPTSEETKTGGSQNPMARKATSQLTTSAGCPTPEDGTPYPGCVPVPCIPRSLSLLMSAHLKCVSGGEV